jgi:hypothetical protein
MFEGNCHATEAIGTSTGAGIRIGASPLRIGLPEAALPSVQNVTCSLIACLILLNVQAEVLKHEMHASWLAEIAPFKIGYRKGHDIRGSFCQVSTRCSKFFCCSTWADRAASTTRAAGNSDC